MFPEQTGKKFNFLCFPEILFSCHQVNLCGNYEGNPPLSPKGGGNPREHPLDPHVRDIFITLPSGYHILGDALAAGAEARYAGAPRSDF